MNKTWLPHGRRVLVRCISILGVWALILTPHAFDLFFEIGFQLALSLQATGVPPCALFSAYGGTSPLFH